MLPPCVENSPLNLFIAVPGSPSSVPHPITVCLQFRLFHPPIIRISEAGSSGVADNRVRKVKARKLLMSLEVEKVIIMFHCFQIGSHLPSSPSLQIFTRLSHPPLTNLSRICFLQFCQFNLPIQNLLMPAPSPGAQLTELQPAKKVQFRFYNFLKLYVAWKYVLFCYIYGQVWTEKKHCYLWCGRC